MLDTFRGAGTRAKPSSSLGNGPAGPGTAGIPACSAAGSSGGCAAEAAAAGRRLLVRAWPGRTPGLRRASMAGPSSHSRIRSRNRCAGQSSLALTTSGCVGPSLCPRQQLGQGVCVSGGGRCSHVRSCQPSSVARPPCRVAGNPCSRHG